MQPSAPSAPLTVPGWRAGDRRGYALELASDSRLEGSPLTQFVLRGEFVVTALNVDGHRVLLQGAIAKPKFSTKLTSKQNEFDRLRHSLEAPFLFELALGGKLGAYYFTDEPSGLVRGVRQLLASTMQAPSRHGPAAGTTEEYDATGRYQVRYEKSSEPHRYLRRKLRYMTLEANTARRNANVSEYVPSVEHSEGSVWMNDGVVERFQSKETLVSTSSQMLPIETKTELSLSPRGVSHLEPHAVADWSKRVARAKRVAVGEPWRPPRDDSKNDDARISGRSFDEVVAGLKELEQAPEPSDEAAKQARQRRQRDLFGALEAFIRSRKGALARALHLIERGDPGANTLLDALGSSGDADAQAALYELIQGGKLDATQRKLAAISLSRAVRPSEATTRALTKLLGDRSLATQAMYGLGTSIRRLREAGEEKRAREVLETVLGQLRNAHDTVARVTVLRSIANSGHEAAFPLVEPLLAAADDEVRAAAVESLQIMRLPQVDGILARHLTSDRAQNVRLAATRAILLRDPSAALSAATTSAAVHDSDPHVRLGALRVLTAWMRKAPELRGVVARVAEQDEQPIIRREATSALQADPDVAP